MLSSSPYYRYCLKRHKEGVEENKLLSVCSRFDQAKKNGAKVFTRNEEFLMLPAQSKSSWAPWTLQVSLHGKVNWKKKLENDSRVSMKLRLLAKVAYVEGTMNIPITSI